MLAIMASKDISQRFVLENSNIRGELTRLQVSYQQVISKGDYPDVINHLLGELMAATVLLSSTLKFRSHLSIQASGDGYLKMIMAECGNDKRIRAIAKVSSNIPMPEETKPTLKQLLGNGQLVITIHPDKGERYQGIVPLRNAALSKCLETYFKRSEQVPTRLFLFCQSGRAGGMLLQMLPTQNSAKKKFENPVADHWNRACLLTETLTTEELLSMPSKRILHRLYDGDDVRLFDEKKVQFHCHCSHERVQQAFMSLPTDELKELLTSHKPLSARCEFCNTAYEIEKKDLESKLSFASAKLSAIH